VPAACPPPPLGRRAFLTRSGQLAGGLWLAGPTAALLASCSDDGSGDEGSGAEGSGAEGSGEDGTASTSAARTAELGALFDPTATYARVGIPQRLTFGLFSSPGAPLADPPAELTMQIAQLTSSEGATNPVGEAEAVPLRIEGLPRGYYMLRFTPEEQGVYEVTTALEGEPLVSRFEVGPAEGPGVVQIGSEMPAAATATTDQTLGVDPLCTRAQNCGFHERSFAEVLESAEGPVALSVSSPAYCAVAICGPVLDLVVDVAPEYPDVTFVHAEPYQNPVPGDPFGNGTAAVMEDLGLTFEPSLFLVRDGILVDRLDSIYDLGELREALNALSP
jgi:hypothetical protein